MTMHENSLETYASIVDGLPKKRATVFQFLRKQPGITRNGVSRGLAWPINNVTGRVKELLDVGLLYEHGIIYTKAGKPRAKLWPNRRHVRRPTEKSLQTHCPTCGQKYEASAND